MQNILLTNVKCLTYVKIYYLGLIVLLKYKPTAKYTLYQK